ncbi:MAG TPA: class I SAM-dependent methyltransferase, partial [Candidatus Limnocylindria bacterium]|nr:class I SAM-dependent methyltransferase [Candidatus Limnocylindria bacterium]
MDQTPAIGSPQGIVQEGIQRTFDEAASYYRDLRWERNRLVRFEKALTQRVLEEELGLGPFASLLEIGCGPGTWTGLLSHRARSVTAIDLSPQMLEQARQAVPSAGVHFVQADAARFDTDDRFDAAVSVRVLEYIPEWAAIVARLGQLVRPQGRVVLVTKTRFSL